MAPGTVPGVTPADLSVIAATLLAWISLVPQIVRLARTGDPTGVSTTWPAIGLVSNAGWTLYLLSRELWAAIPSTVVMVVFYGLVLRALARTGTRLDRSWGRGATWAALLGIAAAIGGMRGLGLVLAWSYVVQIAPAVRAVYAVGRPTGVSVATWLLIAAEAGLWGFYGWWFDDLPVMIYAAVGVLGGLAIVVRMAAIRRSQPAKV
jgi:uncharacterized protein with PQ loop repeat